jgi:PAS domain S-box-containing protein
MKTLFKSLKNKYLTIIATVALIIVVNQTIVQYSINLQSTDARMINTSGRQRMLSQQISKHAQLALYRQNEAANVSNMVFLKNLTDEIEKTEKDLILENHEFRKNKSIDSLLNVNDFYLTVILNSSRNIIESKDTVDINGYLKNITEAEIPFLITMDAIVNIYQQEAEAHIEKLKKIEILLSVITILILILEYVFIISPVFKKNEALKDRNTDLRASQAELKKVKADLEFKEVFNKIFIEQAPNAIVMYDNKMQFMAASQQWYEDNNLFGKETLGRSYYQIFPGTDDDLKAIHQECLKGATNKTDEAICTRKDGSTQWITWDIRPWYISEGIIGGLLMYTADITDIKEKEKERRRIEEILDKTNDIARIGTWEVDTVKGEINWSRMTREIYDVPVDFEPTLETAINFYKKGESRNKIQKAIANAVEKGTAYDVELELVSAKGNEVWVRAIGQAEFKDGTCIRLFGILQDITEIKMSQQALNKANEELNAIFNAGPISIIGTNTEGVITHFNRGAEMQLQYAAEEMIGLNTPEIIHLKKEVIDRGDELSAIYGREIRGFDAFVELAKQGKFESRKWTYVRKDGSTYPVQLIVTALKDEKGDITGFLGLGTDISEMVKNQQKLVKTKNQQEKLTERLTVQNKQLATFAHITSHNLRAPISNLSSLLNLYKISEDEIDKNILFEKFETVIIHLSSTLNTLVDSLKISENNNKEQENLSFKEIFEKTKEIITGQIIETGAKIESDFSKAPDILYNRTYLDSIMLNLLTNALKYRSLDRVAEISIKTERENDHVRLSVSDNGLGIDLEKHGHKLFGLNKTFHRHSDAKGVGLYITKTQIDSMGGTISATSKVNQGTVFTVNF